MKDMDREGAELLMEGIVRQAVHDWRNAKRRLRRNPNNEIVLGIIKDCEIFFLSEWFTALTEMDGRRFLAKLKEEMRLEERKLKHAMKKWLAMQKENDHDER